MFLTDRKQTYYTPPTHTYAANRARKGIPQNKSERRSTSKLYCMPQKRENFSSSSGRPNSDHNPSLHRNSGKGNILSLPP